MEAGPARPRFPKGRGVTDPPFRRWILYGDISEFGDAAGSKDTRFHDNRHTHWKQGLAKVLHDGGFRSHFGSSHPMLGGLSSSAAVRHRVERRLRLVARQVARATGILTTLAPDLSGGSAPGHPLREHICSPLHWIAAMKGQGKNEYKHGKGKHGKSKAPLRKDQWACTSCGWHNFNDRASCHNWNCAHYVAAPQGKNHGKGTGKGGGLRPKARARANPPETQPTARTHRIPRY